MLRSTSKIFILGLFAKGFSLLAVPDLNQISKSLEGNVMEGIKSDLKEIEKIKQRIEKRIKPLKKEEQKTKVQFISSVEKEKPEDSPPSFKKFDRYTRPQLYFASHAPWRIIYFSPNVSYQGVIPISGDTNLSSQDKNWCLNLKTIEAGKSCSNYSFFKKVTRKCEDVQVLNCVQDAMHSDWAQEKWKKPGKIQENVQQMFHQGMEMRIREFVDRGGKLPWVPTPKWCLSLPAASCGNSKDSGQGEKTFLKSAQECNFYEIADCTHVAMRSEWAQKKWGKNPSKIRKNINTALFEGHLDRLAKKYLSAPMLAEKTKKISHRAKKSKSGKDLDMKQISFRGKKKKTRKTEDEDSSS